MLVPVLSEYLMVWGRRLATAARRKPIRVWYVDGCSGPWLPPDTAPEDTSIGLGLRALEDAAASWRHSRHDIAAGAIFVEPDGEAYARLIRFLEHRDSAVVAYPRRGTVAALLPEIDWRIGDDAAVVLADAAATPQLAPLLGPRRDLLVKVMVDHVAGDPADFLRDQHHACMRLRQHAHANLVAALAIPHPVQARTWLRLLAGVNDPAALVLLRDIECRVADPGTARRPRSRQLEMTLAGPAIDRRFRDLRDHGLDAIGDALVAGVAAGHRRFADLVPPILERHHVTRRDVAAEAFTGWSTGTLRVAGLGPRARSIKDDDVLMLPGAATGSRAEGRSG